MKLISLAVLFFTTICHTISAIAQTASGTMAVALPAWQTDLSMVSSQISSPIVGTVLVMAVEVILRAVKTENPKSLLYIISNGFHLVAELLTKLATILDQVLQRTNQ